MSAAQLLQSTELRLWKTRSDHANKTGTDQRDSGSCGRNGRIRRLVRLFSQQLLRPFWDTQQQANRTCSSSGSRVFQLTLMVIPNRRAMPGNFYSLLTALVESFIKSAICRWLENHRPAIASKRLASDVTTCL